MIGGKSLLGRSGILLAEPKIGGYLGAVKVAF